MKLGGNYGINRIMGKNYEKSNKITKQLSSGTSINSASDNASGLVISEKMRAQIRGLERASKNSEEAISFVQTADSIMGSIMESIHRMKELAVQAANDTNTDIDRKAIEKEFKNLQSEIDNMTTSSEFNGINIFEQHEDTYFAIKGNNKFEHEKTLSVIGGLSDTLIIGIDGDEIEIVVPEGKYTTQELADKIDDILFENYRDTGIALEYAKEGTFNLNYENGKSIDFISGGLSYLIYDCNKGSKEGLVIGTTVFNEGEKLVIDKDQNDTISFYVGANKDPITIVLNQGRYSRSEIIEAINKKLDDIGKSTVRASAYGDKFIALSDENDVVTGLKGNMFKIDYGDRIYSSVFYDNTNYGSIEKTNASITSGMKYGNSADGKVTIKAGVNDKLKFVLNGRDTCEITLAAREYTAKEMADALNKIFSDEGIGMKASELSNKLIVESNLSGSTSSISFSTTDTINKNAYESLFAKYEKVNELDIKDGSYSPASIKGNKYISSYSSIDINNTNNVIKLNINGSGGSSTVEIKLNSGTYNKDSLLYELRRALAEKTNKVSVDSDALYIGFKAVDSDITDISFEEASNSAYETLFRTKTNYSMQSITQGTTTVIQGTTSIIDTPANAAGKNTINFPVKIDSSNNQLTYTIGSVNKTIYLSQKIYNTKEELLAEFNSKMQTGDNRGVIVSFNSAGKLIFTSEAKGDSAKFGSFSGTALEIINGYSVSKETVKKAEVTYSKINGKLGVSSRVEINSTNNVLNFQYRKSDTDPYESYSITLKEGKYNSSELAYELNRVLREDGLGDYINASVSIFDDSSYGDGKYGIDIASKKGEGSFNTADTITGSFLDVINKRDNIVSAVDTNKGTTISSGRVTGSYKEVQNAFIVGREEIRGKDVSIISGVNNNLIFDFEMPDGAGGKISHTIEVEISGGTYNNDSLINEIQSNLNNELVKLGLSENLIKTQIGGVSTGMANDSNMFVLKYNGSEDSNEAGNYLIHGVRGTAAYTIFYKKEDNISPASITGTKKLDEIIEIKEGETELSIEVDDIKYDIVLKVGQYNKENFIDMINESIIDADSDDPAAPKPMPISAKIEEGFLKFNYNKLGIHKIDKIQGTAKNIFLEEKSRDENVELEIQIGADKDQDLNIDKIALSTTLLKINSITIEKFLNAEKANQRLDYALEKLNDSRSKYGGIQNRLEYIIDINNNSSKNLQSSESKIRDIDMAKAVIDSSKLNILNQVTMALLNQSKELNNQLVLNILR